MISAITGMLSVAEIASKFLGGQQASFSPNGVAHPDLDKVLTENGWELTYSNTESSRNAKPKKVTVNAYFPQGEETNGIVINRAPDGGFFLTTAHSRAVIPFPYVPEERFSYQTALDTVKSMLSEKRRPLGESIESQLIALFPNLGEGIATALGDLETRVKGISSPGKSFNEVLKIQPVEGLPFFFKAYPNSKDQEKEAIILKLLSEHPAIGFFVPKCFASGNYAGVAFNAIEKVPKADETSNRVAIYSSVPEDLRIQAPQTDLAYVLALVHHYGKDIIKQLPPKMANAFYPNPELIKEDILARGDLKPGFVDKALRLYEEAIAGASSSYETAFIHMDPLSRNVVRSPNGIVPKNIYLIDWERAGVGPIEHDISRATMEIKSRGTSPETFIRHYMKFRHFLSSDGKWLDEGEFRRLYRSVENLGITDEIRQVWGIGKQYMGDPKHRELREFLITGLEQRLGLQGRK